jgi:hypothetical protein
LYNSTSEDSVRAKKAAMAKIFKSLKNKCHKKRPANNNKAKTAELHKLQEKLMRDTFPAQRTIGEIDIADIKIDVRSRDDIPLILLGLQHIYCTDDLSKFSANPSNPPKHLSKK